MALTKVKGSVLETSVATISALPTSGYDGQSIIVNNFYSDVEGGGGIFTWDADGNKGTHNGGTIIDPGKITNNLTTDAIDNTAWFTPTSGTGVWKRQYDGAVNIKWFGVKGGELNSTNDTIALQSCLNAIGTSAHTVEFIYDVTIYLNAPIKIDRNISDASEFRGFLVFRGIGTQAGFYSIISGNMFTSVDEHEAAYVRFENTFFSSDHSTGTYVIDFDNMRRVFFNACYFNEIQLNATSRYVQQLSLIDCVIYNWAGTFSDCLAYYDLTVIGCDFEAGLGNEAKGFTAFDVTNNTSTQTAVFISNTFENAAGPFVAIQNGRGIVVSGNYFEFVSNQVLDFSQGSSLGIQISSNAFDLSPEQESLDTYAPILLNSLSGINAFSNFSTGKLYKVLNSSSETSLGHSIGLGDYTSVANSFTTDSVLGELHKYIGSSKLCRSADRSQYLESTVEDGNVTLIGTRALQAAFPDIILSQKNNSVSVNRFKIDEHFSFFRRDDSTELNIKFIDGVTIESNDPLRATYVPIVLNQKSTFGNRDVLSIDSDGKVSALISLSSPYINIREGATFSISSSTSSSWVSTGISVNAGAKGRTIHIIGSHHGGTGNTTQSDIVMIRCGYDGNNASLVSIATSGTSGGTLEYRVTDGILEIRYTNGGAAEFKIDTNR